MRQIQGFARAAMCCTASALVGLAIPATTWAQEEGKGAAAQGIEEVVITAQKQKQNLQKASVSVTTVSGETISEQGLAQADEVLKNVPGVVVQGAAKGFVIAIRGIGSDLPPGVGESAVSTNFDGVYNFRAESGVLGYYDLSRVEVLRGPQGTLYGRNATGGVVNVISANPTNKYEGYGTVELGNYNLMRLEGAVNAPINDNLAARVAFVSLNRDGFSSNGGNDAVGQAARAKVLYKDRDDTSILLSAEVTKLGGKGNSGTPAAYFDAGQPFRNDYSPNISQAYQSEKLSAQIDLRAGPGMVTFIPAYQHAKGTVWGDMTGGGAAPTFSEDPKKAEQTSMELRYASLPGAPIQWVGGLYYYNLDNTITGNGNPSPTQDVTTSSAVFGQVTYPFSDTLRALVGLRGASDKKSYNNASLVPATNSRSWTAADWKLGLEQDLSPASMVYSTLATGHRPGGFNSFPAAGGAMFDPEKLLSLELGSKNRFLNNQLQVNGDVFYYDYKNFQVSDFFFPAGASAPQLVIQNTKAVKNYGAELETKARLSENTSLDLSATYLHSRYASTFVLHGGPADPPEGIDMNGKQLPHAPDWTFKGGLQRIFDLANGGSVTARADLRYSSDQYVAPYPGIAQLQQAYTTGDLSLLYRSPDEKWSLNAYVRNVADKVVKMAYFGNEYIVGSPRMYGLVFTAKM